VEEQKREEEIGLLKSLATILIEVGGKGKKGQEDGDCDFRK